MKRIELLGLALLALALPCSGQMVLNTGDVWTYDFNNLPHTGNISVFTTNPIGSFAFTVHDSSFQNGDRLLYEMFENSTNESPLVSGIMSSASPLTITSDRASAWQDLQGVVRLSMLDGSVTIDSVTLEAIVSGPNLSQYEIHSSTFVPTPEPGTWGLLALGLAGIAFFRSIRKRSRSG